MLGHLAADQGAARLTATVGDAAHHIGHVLFAQFADGDVVEEEQRLGAARQNVVDAHGHQIDAHRIMFADQLGDFELGANAVGAGNKDGVFHVLHGGGGKQAAEASDIADHLGAIRRMHRVFDGVYGSSALFDIDAGIGISHLSHVSPFHSAACTKRVAFYSLFP